MVDTSGGTLGLLMMPERLPSCFSFEDGDAVDRPPAVALPARRRLTVRGVVSAARASLAARSLASRNTSAAAW